MKMRRIITITFLLLTVTCFSQKLKKKKENKGSGKAIYYVLKSDQSVKHGEYKIKAYSGSAILLSGTYSYGEKTGKWTERYYRKGRELKSIGEYKNNLKVGIWSFYNPKGKLVQRYNYDTKELIKSTECVENKDYEVYINEKIVKSILDCPPSYIGGKEALTYELYKKISRSFDFETNSVGRTKIDIDNSVSFFIDEKGDVNNIKFAKEVEIENLKEFIEKQILERKGKWLAGSLNELKVKSKIAIKIRIKLMF
jgi:hypothetical protein